MWQKRNSLSVCLVLGLGTFGPWVNCPCAPTTPTIHCKTLSRFLCNFFPRMAPHFFFHNLPSNLAESLYPRHIRKKLRKSRNSWSVNSGVKAHGQLTRAWNCKNGLSPETNTNAEKKILVSRLLRSPWYPFVQPVPWKMRLEMLN